MNKDMKALDYTDDNGNVFDFSELEDMCVEHLQEENTKYSQHTLFAHTVAYIEDRIKEGTLYYTFEEFAQDYPALAREVAGMDD